MALLLPLRAAGWAVRDAGDVEEFRRRSDPDRPKAMNQDAVGRIAKAVSKLVAEAMRAGETAAFSAFIPVLAEAMSAAETRR